MQAVSDFAGDRKPQTHFSASTYLQRFWPPTLNCCYPSGTFDDHPTDLTNIKDAVVGSGRMFRSDFIYEMFAQC